MKNKSKLLLGIFLITGVIFLCYMGVTNIANGNPPEADGDDPGNSRGPGFDEALPPDGSYFEFDFLDFIELNSLT
ncbi:MAG: hypothetical protein FK733_13930 [Asgard group archaeon]|nr:hypothetical protein [Asgard group archaeon]